MLEETELVVQPGGDEGQEETGPVDEDGDSPGLEGNQLAKMIERELCQVVRSQTETVQMMVRR